MKTNRFSSYLNDDDEEYNENYKSRYDENEKELTKLGQQIKNIASEYISKMQKNDDENTFLTDDDENEEKKRRKIFVPQSRADFESQRISYPKYSLQITPYVSPKKVKLPSQRFHQRCQYLEQKSKINNNDSNDNIFSYSNDEDFSPSNSNLTPIKKNDTESRRDSSLNYSRTNDQRNSLLNGSPDLTLSKYHQQSPKPQKQQNYSPSEHESSSKVIQTQKFKIQNHKIESKEENHPESPSSRIQKLRKAYEADFPPFSSELDHDVASNISSSQNSSNQKHFIIEEEEEEISDEKVNILDSPILTEEEEEKNEIQQIMSHPSVNNSHNKENKNHDNDINDDIIDINQEEETENQSEFMNLSPNEFFDEENDFENNQNQNIKKGQSFENKSEEMHQKQNKYHNNETEKHPQINVQNPKNIIQNNQKEEEDANEIDFDINEADEGEDENEIDINIDNVDEEEEDQIENHPKTTIQNQKLKNKNKEEEDSNEIDINEADEEDDDEIDNQILNIKEYSVQNEEEEEANEFMIGINETNEDEEIENDFEIDMNEADEEEKKNQIENHQKKSIQNKNDKETAKKSEIDINKADEEENENENPSSKYSYLYEEESKSEFMIDLNETGEEENENENYFKSEVQNQQILNVKEEEKVIHNSIFNIKNQNENSTQIINSKYEENKSIDEINNNKKVESSDKKTKESLNFTTPKPPKNADSLLGSSDLVSNISQMSDLDNK